MRAKVQLWPRLPCFWQGKRKWPVSSTNGNDPRIPNLPIACACPHLYFQQLFTSQCIVCCLKWRQLGLLCLLVSCPVSSVPSLARFFRINGGILSSGHILSFLSFQQIVPSAPSFSFIKDWYLHFKAEVCVVKPLPEGESWQLSRLKNSAAWPELRPPYHWNSGFCKSSLLAMKWSVIVSVQWSWVFCNWHLLKRADNLQLSQRSTRKPVKAIAKMRKFF